MLVLDFRQQHGRLNDGSIRIYPIIVPQVELGYLQVRLYLLANTELLLAHLDQYLAKLVSRHLPILYALVDLWQMLSDAGRMLLE